MKQAKRTFFLIWTAIFLVGCISTQRTPVPLRTQLTAQTPTAAIQAAPPSVATQQQAFTLPTETVPVAILPTETPDPGKEDLPDYYGGLVITLDYVGQTIQMNPGHGFVLRLGSDFDWTIEVDPPGSVTKNQKITAGPGEQGVYIARQKGKVHFMATGTPACLKSNPPCLRPSVLFQITLDIH